MPTKKQTAPAKKKASPPIMGMVEYPDDPAKGRFYVLLPAPPDRLLPSIRVVSGRMVPAYIRLTADGDDGMAFSVGGEREIARAYELRSIMAALRLMDAVWRGVLDAHRPLDARKVERLAEALTTHPEASLALIRVSGVLGKDGSVKYAGDYVRNVIALCYWKLALSCYRGKQPRNGFTMFPPKGGRAWGYSASLINRVIGKALPRSQGWEWNDFTGDKLKSFYNNHALFPPDRK